jgi:hypothetical protein
MKDSQSRYWCMPCGEADQRRKQLTSTHGLCAGCKQQFPKGKLDKHGDYFFCKGCLKKRSRTGATAASSGSGTVMMSGVAGDSAAAPAAAAAERPSHSARKASSGGGGNRRVVVMATVLGVLILLSVLFNVFFAD